MRVLLYRRIDRVLLYQKDDIFLFVWSTFEILEAVIVALWLERSCGVSEFECSNLPKGNSWKIKAKKTKGNEFQNLKINKYGAAIFFRHFPCHNYFYPIKAYKILVP